VHDAVRDRGDLVGHGVERLHRGRSIVRLDNRKLEARRARVDD
jgi:hypothetical protein